MKRYILTTIAILFFAVLTFAQTRQTVNTGPDRMGEPYLASDALRDFAAGFPEMNVGFLHVYADPDVDPEETYLLRGEEASGTLIALLPAKFQRKAQTMNATVYGAAAIRGDDENMFIVRMDGDMSDRLELFAIRDNKVKHLKTLAYRTCSNGKCDQMDSYFTDIDGDSMLDLIQISRTVRGSGVTAQKKRVFVLSEKNRKWKRTNQLDAPWTSVEFYEPSLDGK